MSTVESYQHYPYLHQGFKYISNGRIICPSNYLGVPNPLNEGKASMRLAGDYRDETKRAEHNERHLRALEANLSKISCDLDLKTADGLLKSTEYFREKSMETTDEFVSWSRDVQAHERLQVADIETRSIMGRVMYDWYELQPTGYGLGLPSISSIKALFSFNSVKDDHRMPSYEEITAAGQAAESFLREYDSRMEGRRAEGDAGNVVPDVAWLRNACQKDNPDLQDKAWLLSLGLTPGTGSKEDGERAKERQHFLAIKAFALSATPMTENSACTDNATVDVTSFQSNPVAGADSFMEDCISEDQGLSDDDKYSFVSGCTNNSFSGDQFLEDDDFVVVKEASQCTSR